MSDVVIKNGRIIDGSGNPWYKADIAIEDGVIRDIGKIDGSGDIEIDARGKYVCPGFIDMHSHPDLTLFYKKVQDYKLRQGVTTEVGGNCGFTAAPLNPSTRDALRKYMAFITPPSGVNWNWQTFDQYLQAVEDSHPSTNLVFLVGQGTVRIAAMGFEQRPPTDSEILYMESLVKEAMESGAFGLSTGLVYVPGAYSETSEIIRLAKVSADYGGFYATHMRNEGDKLLDSVREAIDIGISGGLPVQISHHKATGKLNHGRVSDSLSMLVEARNNGLDVTLDQYPYIAGSTTLQAVLPPWAQEGGVEDVVQRLETFDIRCKIRSEILANKGESRMGGDLGDILITTLATELNQRFIGLTIKEISELRGQEYIDTILDLLKEEQCAVGMVVFSMAESDVRVVMSHPYTMIGSDGLYSPGNPHPRIYGTYPRVLGKYVREEGLFSLEEGVRKMTSFPAQRLGLHSKGLLKPGGDADIVVFDAKTVIDKSTFRDPHQYPLGIEYVLVNGVISVDEGEFTGNTAGRVIRSTQLS
ncbi:D-aminoacylase [SAR202 cluster bacterium AC-409-J13_OGT_754m]|nr:D-aminoacylase [SAR202 cluster bacterium AC-409-J13_OGT_754m]